MRVFILMAALLCPLASPALAQGVGESIEVGDWLVRRVQDAGGGIQTCVAAHPGDDQSAVAFGVTSEGKTFVMLIDPKSKQKPGKDYVLEYKVDSGKNIKTTATATNATTLIQVIGTMKDAGPFFTAVEAGDNIHLETDASTYDYPLKGSQTALAALEKCAIAAMN